MESFNDRMKMSNFRDERTYMDVVMQQRRVNDNAYGVEQTGEMEEGKENSVKQGPNIRKIRAEMCEQNLEWLRKSLATETKKPCDSEEALAVLKSSWPSLCMIRDMGSLKFIITFEPAIDMEDAYNNIGDVLKELCVDIRKWSTSEVCYTRCVWL